MHVRRLWSKWNKPTSVVCIISIYSLDLWWLRWYRICLQCGMLQSSCLENFMDRRAWQATVHGIRKSQIRLSDYTFTFTSILHLSLYLSVYIPLKCKVKSESEVAQSCPTLCDPMDCSLSGSSIQGVFQARVLEWGAISFSRGSSRPRYRTWVSCIVSRHFYCLSHQGSQTCH